MLKTIPLLRRFASLRLLAGGVAVVLALALSPAARAHDPHEITADVHFENDRLEVMLTQTHLTALAACGLDTKERQNFGPRQFAEVKAALETGARNVLAFNTPEGSLKPASIVATFTPDGEIEFRLSYPRPASGPVKLKAALLNRDALSDCFLEVTVLIDSKFMGHHVLTVKKPGLEIALPAAPRK